MKYLEVFNDEIEEIYNEYGCCEIDEEEYLLNIAILKNAFQKAIELAKRFHFISYRLYDELQKKSFEIFVYYNHKVDINKGVI